jgi:phage tail-like protein
MATLTDMRNGTTTRSRLGTGARRGFSTTHVRLRTTSEETPAVASARGYLREQLPAIYQEGDLGVRFLTALETLLDPIVGTLDALHAYFDVRLAPRDVLDLQASWLGLAVDESWPDERVRDALRLAGELARMRGTKLGLELALRVAFPKLPLRVEDAGRVTYSVDPDAPCEPSPNACVVYCDAPLDGATEAAVARVIEQAKPVHAGYRFRVKTSRRRGDGETQ